MQAKRDYQGLLFSILGDSISTLDGYNPPECAVFYDREHKYLSGVFAPEDTWWGQVIEALGGSLLVNNAWSGSLVTKHPSCEVASYGCSEERSGGLHQGQTEPDVVMVLLGTNDWGCGMRVEPTQDEQGLNVFRVAYGHMLAAIHRFYPDAEIWCLTLPRSQWRKNPDFQPPTYFAGGHIRQYCDAIAQCARENNCILLDIFDPQNPYDTIDGFHPNAEGMHTISQAVLQQLRKAVNVDDL